MDCENGLETGLQNDLCPADKDRCFASLVKTSKEECYYRRGCCKYQDDDVDCPENKDGHEVTNLYEIWRYSCITDICNTEEATKVVDGSARGDIVIVRGRNSAYSIYNTSMVMVLTAVLIFFKF